MLKAMVTCCCPSETDRDDERGDEHSRLIRNGTGGNNLWGNSGYGTASGGVRDQRNGPAATQADDEQAILARILQDTANSVIDVSTTDAHTVEPREYMERARKYNQQLAGQAPAVPQATTPTNVGSMGKRMSMGGQLSSSAGPAVTSAGTRCLLTDSSAVSSDKVLSAHPVHAEDISMIKQLSSQVARIVADVRVEHKEDLVVQFAPS